MPRGRDKLQASRGCDGSCNPGLSKLATNNFPLGGINFTREAAPTDGSIRPEAEVRLSPKQSFKRKERTLTAPTLIATDLPAGAELAP